MANRPPGCDLYFTKRKRKGASIELEFDLYLIVRHLGMGAVTKRAVAGLLTLAEVGSAIFLSGKDLRGETRPFVRPVAKRLLP